MNDHNHITRDIKKMGECPGCDLYHEGVHARECTFYYECPECDRTFCKHGYLDTHSGAVRVVPWERRCPECDPDD